MTTEDRRKSDAARQRKYYAANKKRIKSNRRKRRPSEDRKYLLKKKYGITPEQHADMFASQDYKCAICSSSDPNTKSGWHTDHCHVTGVVRGILCHRCNLLLGNAQDSTHVLEAAAKYILRAAVT